MYYPGHGLEPIAFRSAERKQRAALLLTRVGGVSTVFIAFASVMELSDQTRGWVIACATAPLKVSAAWATTAKGTGGGIWQAGAGPAADEQGYVYVMTGNGAFDGVTDFGESFVKLEHRPASRDGHGSLAVVDWWTPWMDEVRTEEVRPLSLRRRCPAVRQAWGIPRFQKAGVGPDAPEQGGDLFPSGGWFMPGDMDLGSGGPVLAQNAKAVVGAGKDGILYAVNQENMGQTTCDELKGPGATVTNYKRLRCSPAPRSSRTIRATASTRRPGTSERSMAIGAT